MHCTFKGGKGKRLDVQPKTCKILSRNASLCESF